MAGKEGMSKLRVWAKAGEDVMTAATMAVLDSTQRRKDMMDPHTGVAIATRFAMEEPWGGEFRYSRSANFALRRDFIAVRGRCGGSA